MVQSAGRKLGDGWRWMDTVLEAPWDVTGQFGCVSDFFARHGLLQVGYEIVRLVHVEPTSRTSAPGAGTRVRHHREG